MEQKKKGGNVVNSVWSLAEPLVSGLGLILWDVRYVKEGVNRYLRIIIDKEGGVNINDCVAVNDAIDAPLDELDPIAESYSLQVCSAGIERELVRDFHFEKYIGSKIILKLRTGFESKKIHRCILSGYNGGKITVTFENGSQHEFEKNEYSSVKL
ncbi:MAG: ribosome maturation factor RimP, partial [Oscillospiraceae bacterium]|nr:ribosome maturation factor RimP [Oscillospiraceae bacterium]